jgi:PBP1b-binding outer membrane lipoprotein LpoB
MKNVYLIYFLAVIISSCSAAKFRYVGSKNPPVQKVDVYVDERSIKKQYDIVGKGYAEPNWMRKLDQEKMLEMAIEKAKKNGADAIFFKETFIPTPGTAVNTHTQTDTLGKSVITSSNTSIMPVYGYLNKEILFLKYK